MKTRKLIFDSPLPPMGPEVIFWTCGVCGGGNPLSAAYCQWCG